MAATSIPLTFAANRLTAASSLVEPSAAIDAANGNALTPPAGGWDFDRTVIRVVNTAGVAKSVTVKAGTSSGAVIPADYTVSLAASESRLIPLSPTARYLQADNTILLTYTAGMTGTVSVVCAALGA